MTVHVRLGRAEDIDAAVSVYERSNIARRRGEWPSRGARLKEVTANLRDPDSWFLIAEDEREPVAMALVLPYRSDQGAGPPVMGSAFLDLIYVLPDRWGRGIGGIVLDDVIEESGRRGSTRLHLWTHELDNERAIRLYASRGFERTGINGRDDAGAPVAEWMRDASPPGLSPLTPPRRFEDSTLISDALPQMRMRVDPSLGHLGSTTLEIKGLALAERHHFVQARDGVVRRMLVVQFEGFLASNEEVYRYRLPDPVTLGGETWGSWVFCYSAQREDPSPETADTLEFLSGHGLVLEVAQVMARFARILGDDARNEVLVFYHEPLRALGHSLESASVDGELRPAHASLGTELKARARRSFDIG